MHFTRMYRNNHLITVLSVLNNDYHLSSDLVIYPISRNQYNETAVLFKEEHRKKSNQQRTEK